MEKNKGYDKSDMYRTLFYPCTEKKNTFERFFLILITIFATSICSFTKQVNKIKNELRR